MAGLFRRVDALRGVGQQAPAESLAALFHENTKLQRPPALVTSDREETHSVRELDAMARAFKRYPRHPQVRLPAVPADLVGPPFGDVMRARRSTRTFTSDTVTLSEVSTVLQWSYGITGEVGVHGGESQCFRAAPSAGALYPAEIYLGVRAVEGVDAGIYHYEVREHSLALLNRGDPSSRLYDICCGQEFARQASVVVLISAVVERTKRKYGDRGYRLVLLDIGHLGQNLYLACTSLGLAIVTTCGFFDDEAADLLDIDGCDEAIFYLAFIGRARTVAS